MVNTMKIASIGVKNRVSKNAPTAGVPCKRVEKITGTFQFKKN